MGNGARKLAANELRTACRPEEFPFGTTADLPPWDEVIGQERAVRAIQFGLGMPNQGYNLYISGVPGTGKSTIIKAMIEKISKTRPVPPDWCYVHHFRDADRPKAIQLPAGKGRVFAREMDQFVEFLLDEIPKVFESKEYGEQKSRIVEEYDKAKEALFHELERRAVELGFQLNVTKTGILKVPIIKGKPIQPEIFETLTKDQQRELEEREKRVNSEIRDFLAKIRVLEKQGHEKVDELNRRAVQFAIGHRMEDLKGHYRDNAAVAEYLQDAEEDVLDHLRDFLGEQQPEIAIPGLEVDSKRVWTRYKVNVLVDNTATRGAPVIEEVNPTYNNLVGRLERRARLGALYTDFTMIKAGSILQANGGYLLVNALDVLRNPFSWDALKRAVRKGEVKVEDLAEMYGFVTTGGMKPDPIPVKVKVVLQGSPWLYYLLYAYDEDYRKLFKVKADFGVDLKAESSQRMQYAHFVARLCGKEGLIPFDRSAVAAVVEQASRQAEHQKKLSLRFSELADLIRESSYWAREAGGKVVTRAHVERALEEKVYRSNLLEERIQELIEEGTILVDITGAVVGQVNGLSVYDLGDFSFGKPSRITARIFSGKAGVVNIEREAKLSGRIHNKGVLILSGYLGGKYAQEEALALSATLCFEQSYGEVEGDSASAAELFAILSGLAEAPIRQDLAVTGSINQRGEIQAVGGINEKIEGFYAVCKAKGMTGEQGVLIPETNVRHLMLKPEVVRAVEAGQFHLYAIRTVDEGMAFLTGSTVGERRADGSYPPGTVNARIAQRLREMAKRAEKAAGPEAAGEKKAEEGNEGK